MILMFHHVAPLGRVPSGPPTAGEEREQSISPSAFETLLRRLMDRGFKFVSLDAMVDEISRDGYLLGRRVAITMDDGWLDNYEHALPVLQKLGLPATLFIATEQLRKGIQGRQKMTPAQLREMHRLGFAVGGHTRTHTDLTKLPLERAVEEIRGCKRDLEDFLGAPVNLFAYPGGAFNETIARAVRDAGFKAACSLLGLGINTRSSMFWLSRDVLSENLNTLGDRLRLSRIARLALYPRTRWRLEKQLAGGQA